jgi:hypothetical protein
MLTRLRGLAAGLVRRLRRRPQRDVLVFTVTSAEQFAAFGETPRARRRYSRAEFRVDPWFAVRPDWSGRLGPLPGVRALTTSFDVDGRTARATLELAKPLAAHQIVRAAHPLFYPERRTTGWGGERIGLWPGAPSDQRREPGGAVRPLLPKTVRTERATDYEIVIDQAGEHWLGDLDDTVKLIDRPAAPAVLIDPKVHRPLDRSQPREGTLSAVATAAGDRLLVRSGSRVLLDAPLSEPLTATGLQSLALVTDVEASGIGTGHAASCRVAELAAYGAVVHDAPVGLALDPVLARLVEAPFRPVPLLDHVNRSLNQVRAVMRAHTRVLASRPWPSVSVLLATMRPALLEPILEQLAAQDHPEVEVVIGCHGFAAPSRDSLPEHLRSRVGPILAFDRTELFGDVLAKLSAAAGGELVSKVDDDDLYGPHHLADLMMAWQYSEAQLVGRKLALIHYEDEGRLYIRRLFMERYRWSSAGGASIIARGDLAAVGGWRSQRRAVDAGLLSRIADAGGLVYACSGPGYIHVRHNDGHTWEVAEARFKEKYLESSVVGIPDAAYGVL